MISEYVETYKYAVFTFSKKILDDLFLDYGMNEQVDNIKKLIEVEIKKLEVSNNRREKNIQNVIAIVLALLSSEGYNDLFY